MFANKTPLETTIMVTGGAGFIGSHTIVELLNAGYNVVCVDNLYNASEEVIDRIATIVGKSAVSRLVFKKVDLLDKPALDRVFSEYPVDVVIHFAGYKAVGESVEKPLEYYSNNLISTLNLCELMKKYSVTSFIFSSSATVYGEPDSLPLTEDAQKKAATNPYGWTKWMIEQILCDIAHADPSWSVVLLRYFNPIGAHKSGLIGENPNGIPNNLVPYVAQTAIGKREAVQVFGDDYPTPDGTGVRDYIHVVDLAQGHLKAISWVQNTSGTEIFNLGTGKGSSVLEVISAFSEACGKEIPYKVVGRRAGDIPTSFADPTKAAKELDWKAQYTLLDMCKDAWNWQQKNPDGYKSSDK